LSCGANVHGKKKKSDEEAKRKQKKELAEKGSLKPNRSLNNWLAGVKSCGFSIVMTL
jgi:hypothetical protein